MKKVTVFAAVILAAACAKVDLCMQYDTTIGASLEATSTKTSLDGLGVVWSDGDAISVFSHDLIVLHERFNIEAGGGRNGIFKGHISNSQDVGYFAVYPYSESNSSDGKSLGFIIPAEQEYAAGSFAKGANVSVAAFSYGTKDNIEFKNVCGILKLQLKAPEGTCVSKITIEDTGGNLLCGSASLIAESIVSGTPDISLSEGLNRVTLNVPDVPLNMDTAVPFFIVVPAGAFNSGFKAEVLDTKSYKRFTLTAGKGNTVERSTIMEMPEVVLDSPEENIDLSANGTSNCYLVSETGACNCMFFAGAKGNAGLEASGSNAISPASADLLWATTGASVPPAADGILSNVQLQDSYIHFNTRGVKGNAVIAARDASGNILWSWHIWIVPGMDIESESSTNVCGPLADGLYWIDRNLGALANTEDDLTSAGLLYQWGRKDPFTSTDNYTKGTDYTDEQRVAGTEPSFSTVASTVAESILHPTVFYAANNWLKTNDNSLWGETKTIYDPCPVGYKVVPYTDFSRFTMEKKTYGFHLAYNGVDAGWFPMVGRRNKNTGSMELVSQYSHFWTALSTDSGVGRFYIYYRNESLKCDASQSAIRAMGNAVRCCRE